MVQGPPLTRNTFVLRAQFSIKTLSKLTFKPQEHKNELVLFYFEEFELHSVKRICQQVILASNDFG